MSSLLVGLMIRASTSCRGTTHPHRWRTFVTTMLDAGVDLRDVTVRCQRRAASTASGDPSNSTDSHRAPCSERAAESSARPSSRSTGCGKPWMPRPAYWARNSLMCLRSSAGFSIAAA
ncbi:hypothetical protein ETD83_04150 [Actinomadura soli]|uniref:Uncharacterized protein n=1 Tax=Actinomadura soli TaxID=2508997 RepID=A0A5C4JIF6_9ACTN|nr:hypothetical protein ETD83_04150 [Actinomadura soli]